MKISTLLFSILLFIGSCKPGSDLKPAQNLIDQLATQLNWLVAHTKDDKQVPRSFVSGNYNMVDPTDWTSGFVAGNYWLMYELTGDENWKKAAVENTLKLEGIQYITNTHDIGFMIYSSYGNGYRITKDAAYKSVILQAAESLSKRFNPKVGCIRSWDFGTWQFPVIIDNMMNLEMLFWASKVSGNPKYTEIAVQHANTTLLNHFRANMSSYHLVDYDTITGMPIKKQTWQGLNDESSWARGQAWGLYGFTVCYRETGDIKYLNAAKKIATYISIWLPEDKVPYWDFNAPVTPATERDASAASITASALYILSSLTDDSSSRLEYSALADKIITSLNSTAYLNSYGLGGGFLLRHVVGGKPFNMEVDASINYADYYYLEALKYKMK
jgi:unsaturated chondroitin disaccharide hydrolase